MGRPVCKKVVLKKVSLLLSPSITYELLDAILLCLVRNIQGLHDAEICPALALIGAILVTSTDPKGVKSTSKRPRIPCDQD